MAELQAGRELDALIAEKVMGECLKPHRDVAMVAIGGRKVSSTGPTFMLTNGREIPMPNGEKLRKPEGCADWNARYFLHVLGLGNSDGSSRNAKGIPRRIGTRCRRAGYHQRGRPMRNSPLKLLGQAKTEGGE